VIPEPIEREIVIAAPVERVEPTCIFTFRWARLPDDEPGAGNSTLVEFTLTPEDAGTRLRVVESGFRHHAVSDDERAAAVDDNTQGWLGGFAGLRAYLESAAA
jgi:uncharacterized protein YndB with AHSA1/START domain